MSSALIYSIIIPAYNSADTLQACLSSLEQQRMDRAAYEIIVVDDGSQDNTEALVRSFAGVRYIGQANQGPAAARNRGVEVARGDIVLFIDADCVPFPDWLEQMVKPFAQKEIAGVKGAYRSRQHEIVAQVVQLEYEIKYLHMLKDCYIDFIDTYAAAFRKSAFLQTGGYDTGFTRASVEDQEFSFRMAGRGYKMIFNPQALVWHRHAASLEAYCRKKWKIGYWKVKVLRRHPGKMVRDSHTPQLLKLEIVSLAAGAGLGVAGLFLGAWLLITAGFFFAAPFLLISLELQPVWKSKFFYALCSMVVFYLRAVCLAGGLASGLIRFLGEKGMLN